MSCTYYRWNGGTFGDYWCDKKNTRVDSDTYYKYCRAYNYDECPIYRNTESSGCFITTIACSILKRKDNDKVLNNLRYLRDDILQKDPKYHNLLKDYDNIGPQIASCLEKDEKREEISLDLYNNILTPISNLIDKKEYNQACRAYYTMTLFFKDYYGLEYQPDNRKNINIKLLGHGKRKINN